MHRTAAALTTLACVTSLAACSGAGEPAGEQDVKQSVTADLLPPIVQPGPRPAAADAAKAVVSARVTPAEKGREVTLQSRSGGGWKSAGTAETNPLGTADFTVDQQPDTTYRVVVTGAGDLPDVTSEPVDDVWLYAFSDEFDGTALDEAQWFYRGAEYNVEGYRACSKGSPDAAEVSAGVLRLLVARDPARTEQCTAKTADGEVLGQFDYRLNGHVASKALIHYGVTSARIRFPRPEGQHGSFWFQSHIDGGKPNPTDSGSEIDVVEYFGDRDDDRLASFIYYPTEGGSVKEGDWIEEASRFLAGKDDDWWKAFHVFTLEWTPEEYVIRIDGQEAWRTDQGVSQQAEFIVLSLLSSDYELPKLKDEDNLPQGMAVDWVRAWGK